MRKRRAQFFAPGIKKIGVDREALIKDYEEYVKRKRRIKVDPELIDELFTKKKVLYRSASTEALLRHRDVMQFESSQPLPRHKKQKGNFDLRSQKSREGSIQLDSQRSVFLDNQFEELVEKAARKEEDIKRYQEHEMVPDFEQLLHEKELKIVVKMANH